MDFAQIHIPGGFGAAYMPNGLGGGGGIIIAGIPAAAAAAAAAAAYPMLGTGGTGGTPVG